MSAIAEIVPAPSFEREMMLRALALARRGSGFVSPNPMVGAIVMNDGEIVGSGWHRRYGAPHAEVEAIQSAGERAKGGTLYVTLEPCNHYGRTPPCTDLILSSGIKRVVAAMADPNTAVRGGGFARLRDSGVEVNSGVLEPLARELNIGWLYWLKTGSPFVLLKFAVSLDGKIDHPGSAERWISSDVSRAQVHRIRRHVDAIVVGAGTVVTDNPLLTNRSGSGGQPLRVVIDSTLRSPARAQVFRQNEQDLERGTPRAICFTTSRASFQRRRELELAGVEVIVVDGENQQVDVSAAFRALGRLGVQTVLCEGGPTLGSTLLDEGLAHRLLLYQAPVLVGDAGNTFYHPKGEVRSNRRLDLRLRTTRKIGRDHLLVYDNERALMMEKTAALRDDQVTAKFEGERCSLE